MKELKLFNTAHPLADTGKPIFIPFGEWKYDATRRQRLDRAHGERIANELNARVARGEPGIPVYQGHPDVPELASKYPDKGALGWVTKIELSNESRPDGRTVSGLNLTVEWDRDPGKGFKWFSPYWFANESEGNVHIVGSISSIGLVNNPNIAEFRLANEDLTQRRGGAEKVKLRPEIIELAAKYDRLANEANFDESKHPRADDGKFTSGGGGTGGGGKPWSSQKADDWSREVIWRSSDLTREGRAARVNNAKAELGKATTRDDDIAFRKSRRAALHRAAIAAGLTYNIKTFEYE